MDEYLKFQIDVTLRVATRLHSVRTQLHINRQASSLTYREINQVRNELLTIKHKVVSNTGVLETPPNTRLVSISHMFTATPLMTRWI